MTAYEGPAIVELMGFIRTAGHISEVEQYGGKMARLDIPGPDGQTALTQFFSAGAIYRVTPTTQEIVNAFGPLHLPQPVARYELPAVNPGSRRDPAGDDEDDDDEAHDDEDTALSSAAVDRGPF